MIAAEQDATRSVIPAASGCLRDGKIRCLKRSGRASALKVLAPSQ